MAETAGEAIWYIRGSIDDLMSALDGATQSVSEATGQDAIINVVADTSEAIAPIEAVSQEIQQVAAQDAVIDVSADTSQAGAAMDQLTQDVSQSTDQIQQETAEVSQSTDGMGSVFMANTTKIGAGVTAMGAGIVGGLVMSVKAFADTGDALRDMSQRTGVSTEELSKLKFVLEQNGASLSTFELAQKNLTKSLAEGEVMEKDRAAATAAVTAAQEKLKIAQDALKDGTGNYNEKLKAVNEAQKNYDKALTDSQEANNVQMDALQKLGLNYKTIREMKPEEAFKTIAFAIGQAGDHTTQAQIAMDLFGARVGTQLLPMIKEGKGSFEELSKRAEELGIVFDQDAADAADKFNDSMNELKYAFQGVMIQIGPIVADIVEDLLPSIFSGIKAVKEWVTEHEGLTKALVIAGGAIGTFAGIVGPLIIALPGLVTTVGLLKTALGATGLVSAAAEATPAITGVGATAVTATTNVGGLTAALGGIAFPATAAVAVTTGILAIGASAASTVRTFMDLEETERSLSEATNEYARQLKAKGVAIDSAKMASMSYAQQQVYLSQQEKQNADTMARAWFQYFTGRGESEKEFAQMRNLMLNKNISAEEAAIAVKKKLSDDELSNLMKAGEEETAFLLEKNGIKLEATKQTEGAITEAELQAAAQRNDIWRTATDEMAAAEYEKADAVKTTWSDAILEIMRSMAGWPLEVLEWLGGATGAVSGRAEGGMLDDGMTIVGERGPEAIIKDGSSAKVISNANISGIGEQATGAVTINISGVSVSNDYDVERMAKKLAELMRQRSTGIGGTPAVVRA